MGGDFRVGDWLVQRDLNLISNGDRLVQLEPKVMDVLVELAEHPGEVLSREALLGAVWSDTHVTDEVLTYSVFELRKAFADDAKKPRVIQTVPRRGYRLILPVTKGSGNGVGNGARGEPEAASVSAEPRPEARPSTPAGRRPRWLLYAGGVALSLIVVAALWYHPWSPALTASDMILLADFDNATGDPVFDGTLKHALAIHLGQTPYLNIVPEERVRETLPYMGRSPDEPVTPEIGREICVRRGFKFLLAGSVASLGRNYVVSLEAINGQTGDVIAREQVEVGSREQMLNNLGTVATALRRKLGESHSSIGRFDVPLEQATTPSLEAFKHYSTGRVNLVAGRMTEAIPHYLQALEHDSGFASAYDDLAWCYDALSQRQRAAECARKAFALKDRISEYERLSVTAIYYIMATGENDKAIETLERMRSIYPNRAPVHNTLGGQYAQAGQLDQAIASLREAIRLNRHPNAYANLAWCFLRADRMPEALQTVAEAKAQGVDNRQLHTLQYILAFNQGNWAAMDDQVRWAAGRPDEPFMLSLQGNAAAFGGRMREARALTARAVEMATRRGLGEAAADFESDSARREALYGNCAQTREYVDASLARSRGWRVLSRAAWALALCGDADEAQSLADEIALNLPAHTNLKRSCLPVVRAVIELSRGNNDAAIDAVGPGACDPPAISPWPMYFAGEAHLRRGDARSAETEFRSILNHRGLEPLSPVFPVAQLGLARALVRGGDRQGGRKAFEEFFVLWKDADPDTPVLRQARTEYAALNQSFK